MAGYEAVVERLRRSTVQVLNGRGGGSGVPSNEVNAFVRGESSRARAA